MVDQPGPPGAPRIQQKLESAYRELLEALWFAHQVFKKDGRDGVRVACHAVARFIWVRHENPELAALRQALLDFDRGVMPELLSRDPASKERSRSSQREHVRCLASPCLEVLVELGEPLEQAAAHVARRVSRWAGLGRLTVTARTVQNWREAHRASEQTARRHFESIRDYILSLSNPRAEVERLLSEGPPDVPES